MGEIIIDGGQCVRMYLTIKPKYKAILIEQGLEEVLIDIGNIDKLYEAMLKLKGELNE